jgi:hypothetical protein
MTSVYGFFPGGDPRDFTPDPECSTDTERAQHKRDCEAWDRGECPNVNAKAPHFKDDTLCHVTPAGYGLGVYEYDEDYDLPDELRPHDFDSTCECWECYEAGVLRRFRGERTA